MAIERNQREAMRKQKEICTASKKEPGREERCNVLCCLAWNTDTDRGILCKLWFQSQKYYNLEGLNYERQNPVILATGFYLLFMLNNKLPPGVNPSVRI